MINGKKPIPDRKIRALNPILRPAHTVRYLFLFCLPKKLI